MRKILALTLAAAIASLGVPGTVSAAGQQVQAQSMNGRVAGFVKDSGGQPVGNRGVQLRDVVKNQVLSRSRTDSAGAFAFDKVPSGTYVVEVVSDRGAVAAVSGPQTLSTGSMLVEGLVIVLDGTKAAAAMVAGGGFFSSTGGMLVLAAIGAGVVAGLAAVTLEKSPSK